MNHGKILSATPTFLAGKCCLIYHDPHPHLELDPLFGSIENNNLKMAKLLMIASHKLYYDVLTTLKDIVFRTNYAKDAHLTQSSLRQYAIFFAHVLSMPRTLKEMARGIIRKQLGLYPKDKIDSLKLPDRVRDYVTLTGLETICSKWNWLILVIIMLWSQSNELVFEAMSMHPSYPNFVYKAYFWK